MIDQIDQTERRLEKAAAVYRECKHATTDVRRKVNGNGVLVYRKQCMLCGSGVGNWIARESVKWLPLPWDEALEAKAEATRQALYDHHRMHRDRMADRENREWWELYNQHLNSDYWADMRNHVLKRDNWLCQSCLSARATQVHHKTYKNLGQEHAWELESICRECHERIHPHMSSID